MSRIDPRLVALAKTPLRSGSLGTLLAAREPAAALPAQAPAMPRPIESAEVLQLQEPVESPAPAPTAVEAALQNAEGVPPPVADNEPDLIITAEGEPAQDDEADRRNNGRKTQMIPAAVTWRGLKQPPIAGVVRDMSMTGVRLQMPPKKFGVIGSVGDVPDRFILILKNDQIQYECEVAWRNSNQLGAKFLGRAHPIAAEFKSKRGY